MRWVSIDNVSLGNAADHERSTIKPCYLCNDNRYENLTTIRKISMLNNAIREAVLYKVQMMEWKNKIIPLALIKNEI